MENSDKILSKTRFFWMLGIAGTLIGFISWFTIPKEEDPRLKPRFGFVKLIYPGASVPQIQKYVVEETERELASVEAIEKISTTIRSGFAGIRIEFKATLKDDSKISRSWDEVQDALDKAYKVFPEGALEPDLDRKLDQEAMLVSVSVPEDNPVQSHEWLIDLENELLKNPNVSRIRRIGDEGSQISIQINEQKLSNSGLSINQLLGQILLANTQIASGYIETDQTRINIQATNAFERLDELKVFRIATTNGYTVPLESLANIQLEFISPEGEEMRWMGKKVLGLGLVSKKGIDLRKFGSSVEKSIAKFKSKFSETESSIKPEVTIINSQPDYVKGRLNDLSFSLLSSIGLLSIFMILFMGIRVGLAVSIMLPVISLISFAIYSVIGGILHQIAIAAFVLSFGILIDNIVVIVESIQEKLDQGLDKFSAGSETIREFQVPLLSSTITTIASFLPMALANDTSAEFTEAIPKIVIISLIVSFLASIFLSPSLSMRFLQAKKKLPEGSTALEKLGLSIANVSIQKPKTLLLCFLVFLLLDFASFPFMKFKFFPSADRNQAILELSFPEGTAYSKTKRTVMDLETKLNELDGLKGIASFIGRSTAYFYYNLPQKPNAPHLSQILLVSNSSVFPLELENQIKEIAQETGARIRMKSLEQGPPLEASIIVRVYHSDNEFWKNKLYEFTKDLNQEDTVALAWTESIGIQEKILFETDDAELGELGGTRRDVSLGLLKSTYGIPAGFFKTGKESVPIKLTSINKELTNLNSLNNSLVVQTPERAISASRVTKIKKENSEAIHTLYNRKSYVSMMVDLKRSENPSQLTSRITDMLIENGLSPGEDFEFDGEQGNSQESNSALMESLPIGMTILLATLMWQFNSYRLLLIILTTVPTAFLGLVPGLVISGQPFGFLPLLALFALIGIAVNNGIILIDKFQSSMAEGSSAKDAVRIGVSSRLRPILLTSGSTILGMIPLGFSSSTLWPPFAWAMVSGLLVSSVSTLFIIPRLYLMFYDNDTQSKSIQYSESIVDSNQLQEKGKNEKSKKGSFRFKNPLAGLMMIFFFSTLTSNIQSQDLELGLEVQNPSNQKINDLTKVKRMSLNEIMEEAKNSFQAKAAYHEAAQAKAVVQEAKRGTYLPKIGLYGERVFRDKDLYLETPAGNSNFGNRNFNQTGLELYQPLWNAKNMYNLIPSAELMAEAARKKAVWEGKSAQFNAINSYIDCAGLKIRLNSFDQRISNLNSLNKETRRLVNNGKAKEIDLLKIDTSVKNLERAKLSLTNQYNTCTLNLGRLLGKDYSIEPIEESVPFAKIIAKDSLSKTNHSSTKSIEEDLDLPSDSKWAREDLEAFSLQIDALVKEKSSYDSENLPEVYAKGNLVYSDQANINPFTYSQVAVGAKWTVFDGGIRSTKIQQKEEEIKKLKEQFLDATRSIEISKKDWKGRILSDSENLKNLEEELDLILKRSNSERQRARSGRSSNATFYEIQDMFYETEQNSKLNEWELLRSKIGYMYSCGNLEKID